MLHLWWEPEGLLYSENLWRFFVTSVTFVTETTCFAASLGLAGSRTQWFREPEAQIWKILLTEWSHCWLHWRKVQLNSEWRRILKTRWNLLVTLGDIYDKNDTITIIFQRFSDMESDKAPLWFFTDVPKVTKHFERFQRHERVLHLPHLSHLSQV